MDTKQKNVAPFKDMFNALFVLGFLFFLIGAFSTFAFCMADQIANPCVLIEGASFMIIGLVAMVLAYTTR